MAYDSAATRAPLLDAAYAEFSERGLAGARVERITENELDAEQFLGTADQPTVALLATSTADR